MIIQEIFSEVSGVMFCRPDHRSRDRMIIESVFGQGEAVVSGRVEPDTYILDKTGPPGAFGEAGQAAVQDRTRPGRG